MKMMLVAALVVLSAASAQAITPDRVALAAQLYARMESLGPAGGSQELIRNSLGAMTKNACLPYMQAEMEQMISRYSKPAGAKQLAIDAYASEFSAEQLQAILAFADTPAGAQFFAKMPVIMGKASAYAMQHFENNQSAIAKETMAILEHYKEHACNK